MASIWAGRTMYGSGRPGGIGSAIPSTPGESREDATFPARRAAETRQTEGDRGVRPRIVALDGARTLGAKILVAGGGRCNVTHDVVDETAYAGSSRNAIKKVLRQFDVPRTVDFFRELGVDLKREETGKLFPTTDDARTVLSALLGATRDAGVEIVHPCRVVAIGRKADGFELELGGEQAGAARPMVARRVILCTGGKALPKSGSDGGGYELAKSLGHTITPDVFPALVPLVLAKGHWMTELSGVTIPATIEVRTHGGKKLQAFTGSTLMTHFGLSGPAVLDVSRYWMAAVLDAQRQRSPRPKLVISFVPGKNAEAIDDALVDLGRQTVLRWMCSADGCGLPERLARAIASSVGVDATLAGHAISRSGRRSLAAALSGMDVPVTGDRGFTYAEATAGGVPLSEIRLETMESRVCPGVHLCGEICDVDGRIGGYNFQWAWASGFVAGVGAAKAIRDSAVS